MFSNPLDPDNKVIKSKIMEWLKSNYSISNNLPVSIENIQHCTDNNCPDSSTLIRWYDTNGSLYSISINKPLVYIRKWDIEAGIQKLNTAND